MGTHWKVAERYSSILQRVLDEYGEYQSSGGAAADGEHRTTPSTVKILADMRRCAFDLDFLISRQPRSSPVGSSISQQLPPAEAAAAATAAAATPAMPSRNLAPNELEYLDIFGFFNVPRVLPTKALDLTTTNLDVNEESTNNNNNPMSVHGLTGGAMATATAATDVTGSVVDGSSSNMNEFNITNYLIPTPETDWLFRSAG